MTQQVEGGQMDPWWEDETRASDFGDERLDKRLGQLLEAFGGHPLESIPMACRGWAETQAAYRFFSNGKVDFERVLEGHREATLERIRMHPVVLMPQDTTELDWSVTLGAKGLGTLKEVERRKSHLHPSIAVTPERVYLGCTGATHWERTESSSPAERRVKPVEEKESYRWLEHYELACAVQGLAPRTQVVSLADREGDIMELFLEAGEHEPQVRADWIVRAAQDRRVDGSTEQTLWAHMAGQAVCGQIEFDLPRRGEQPARRVRQTVRAATVKLAKLRRPGHTLPAVSVNVVCLQEIDPPEGQDPLEWMLLTSLPVGNYDQVRTVIEWYLARWAVEIFFRVLKHGCKVEDLRLREASRLDPALAVFMIVAWRVLWVTMLARKCPEVSCEVILSTEEWQSLWITVKHQAPPREPPALGQAVMLIAMLGGFLGRKHDGAPGPKAVWTGLQRLYDHTFAIRSYKSVIEAQERTYQTAVEA